MPVTDNKSKPGPRAANDPYGHKVQALSALLYKLAVERGVGAKLPTIRELSDELQTSSSSIDIALKDLEARNVIYRKRGSGIYVSPKIHRKNIAVVFNSYLLGANASPFWGILLSHLAKYAETRGQTSNQDFEFFMTSPSRGRNALPDHVMNLVRSGAIAGVVGISLNDEGARWILDQGIPCISYAGWSKWTVLTGGEQLIQDGLKVLADQGCRNIEYWGLPHSDGDNPVWYEQTRVVVETAYGALGLEPPQTLVGPAEDLLLAGSALPARKQDALYRAYTASKALFSDPARVRPDGIFVADDMMASRVLFGLMELGVRPGVDIKIASLANRGSPILFGLEQYLTLLEYDPAEIVDALIQLLDQAMAAPDLPETQISVPWRPRVPEEFK